MTPDAADRPEVDEAALAFVDRRLSQLADAQRREEGRRRMWLAHHWPEDYHERCATIAGRPVCRRCAALYPLGLLVAVLSVAGAAPWPASWDPGMIWLLCLPATVAYCGEALGVFRYDARWQVGTMLVTAVAFGRALGYELEQRWSPEFWGPVAVFGGMWFFATLVGKRLEEARERRRRREDLRP